MSNINNARQGVRNIPEICFQQGLTKAVICPGSRNAPLILSFTLHPELDCLSITDERSAGYFALGMTQTTGNPVALVCTSGTAVLNFAPAIAEAYYQNLPLVVFTADRPKEWIDQADGQTIRQTEIYRNYIKQSFELSLETCHADDLWHFNRVVSQAIDTAVQYPAGPVHINIPLREPLYTPLPDEFKIPGIIKTLGGKPLLHSDEYSSLINKWNKAEKKMLVLGMFKKDEKLNALAQEMTKRTDTLVVAENISNVAGEDVIYAPEPLIALLTDDEKLHYKPDLVISIGEGLVSKRLKQYLRAFPPSEQWYVSTSGNYTDTFKSLSLKINANPVDFLEKLIGENPSSNELVYEGLKQKNRNLADLHLEYLSRVGLNDFRVIHEVLSGIPEGSAVHLANSAPVRYAQLSPSRGGLTYFSNRGTSGIDGCISTAAGCAYISGKPVFVVSGDLAFIYDSNALWHKYSHLNLKIVVINNNGGNIFSLIDSGSEMDRARMYFETPHQVKIKALAEAYGAGYLDCTDVSDLKEKMQVLARTQGICILEIKTDAKQNTKVFKEYYQFIKH
jgi:2-succinyl-5-enolpyruvyl-6-hydroxy-3-cyclohexene-1-carboxylate synthase